MLVVTALYRYELEKYELPRQTDGQEAKLLDQEKNYEIGIVTVAKIMNEQENNVSAKKIADKAQVS